MSRWIRIAFVAMLCLLCGSIVSAQDGIVKGRVMDSYGRPIAGVKVLENDLKRETTTNEKGEYEMALPSGKHFLDFSAKDYKDARHEFTLAPGATKRIFVKMQDSYKLETTEITEDVDPTDMDNPDRSFTRLIPINPRKVNEMPGVKSDMGNKIATIAVGVSTSSELSSQYRVRGGNFDENLIYVDDVEIYRPFLIRTGQQEGLGFVNPNLASEVAFSSGGFQAKYGDKMSSVLDVRYSEPEDFHGSAELGVLNQNIHFEGQILKKPKESDEGISEEDMEDPVEYRPGRLTYLVGARRFTPSYVLNSLDVQGEYKPQFHDLQGQLTFSPRHKLRRWAEKERKNGKIDTVYYNKDRLKFSFLFNLANNHYVFTPVTRETSFGTIQQVFRLLVAFQGQDISSYTTGLGAFTIEARPNVRLRIKHIFTGFQTVEAELFDVEGGYWLSDVNTNFGSEGYNETVFDRGIGTFYRHGRNYLEARVFAAEQRGDWFPGKAFRHKISWGLRAQRQLIEDELREWNGTDSAGYFSLDESFRTHVNLNSTLFKGYFQDHWKISKDQSKRLIFGARALYNDLNDEFLVAPRIQFVIDPNSKIGMPGREEEEEEGDQFLTLDEIAEKEKQKKKEKKKDYQLRFAAGVYHQPLFYREMRAFDGTINPNRPAQASYHLIAGGDYQFKIWNRPFKLTVEGYYKHLENLVPYEVDNVRIRYYPFNTATGYAVGLDTRVTGEFIKGVDSWMTIGVLKTQEKINELNQGYVSRPTDQRLQFSTYFQDELPINPTYKVHINFVYGSGIRFGPPRVIENRTVFRVPSYQRVDLGFSKLLLLNTPEERADKKVALESLWISAEIFNLFQRSNTISYVWVKDVFNTQFAVPNFLSARLLNLRVIARF